MPDRDLLSMLERLMGDEPGLLSMWSRMMALIVDKKASCGLAHLSDQEVADNAAGMRRGKTRSGQSTSAAGLRLVPGRLPR